MLTTTGVRSAPSRANRSVIAGTLLLAAIASAPDARAQDTRPYDERLLRLAEMLGAVHYLRELCGNDDGQMWRDRMQDLLRSEGSSALRQYRLTRSFNQGYSSYRSTYRSCTPSAEAAITRFLTEGAQIAEAMARSAP